MLLQSILHSPMNPLLSMEPCIFRFGLILFTLATHFIKQVFVVSPFRFSQVTPLLQEDGLILIV